MKYFKPSETLSPRQVTRGLNLVIQDGMAAEAMTSLTGGAFLVAMALKMGASNFQIGLLAALPSLTPVFQLISIWLVQKFQNRRLVAVCSNVFARFPLLIIGTLPLLFSAGTSLQVLIFFLFFHYFFGSIAGPSWNSWMKDLVPENKLGTYFSRRSRITQTLNVVLSLLIALTLDHVKKNHPENELTTYAIMFIVGGLIGLLGAYILSRVPEPKTTLPKANLLKLFAKPLKDVNFRNLLVFNSFWSFALNLATPFFTVYMLKAIGLPLSYVIAFGIINQVSSILAIKMWGRYSDLYSNKTIIQIAAPLYIFCILAWAFVSPKESFPFIIAFIVSINVMSGISTAGINLAITNIGIKLAPHDEAIVYLSTKNIIVAFISSIGPLIGGWLADYFANRSFHWNIEWNGPQGTSIIHLIYLQGKSFLFVIGGLVAIGAVRLLKRVKEKGEINKDIAVAQMRVVFRKKVKSTITREALLSLLSTPITYPIKWKKRIERQAVIMSRWNRRGMERRTA